MLHLLCTAYTREVRVTLTCFLLLTSHPDVDIVQNT